MRRRAGTLVLTAMVAVLWAASAEAQSSDLISSLSKELGATTQQAQGAAGSLFNYAKGKMSADDWKRVAASVPGMDGLLKAAPAAAAPIGTTGVSGLDAAASKASGLSSVAGAFSKLGLSPELVAKAVPILTSFVTKSGGADVGKLLAAALK